MKNTIESIRYIIKNELLKSNKILKKANHSRKLSINILSRLIGLSANTLYNVIEKESRDTLSKRSIEKIAKYFNVTMEQLESGELLPVAKTNTLINKDKINTLHNTPEQKLEYDRQIIHYKEIVGLQKEIIESLKEIVRTLKKENEELKEQSKRFS